MTEPRSADEPFDHLARYDKPGDRRYSPRDDDHDEHPPKRLEVLDHRHALFLDR
jgi:hypothetical protein